MGSSMVGLVVLVADQARRTNKTPRDAIEEK